MARRSDRHRPTRSMQIVPCPYPIAAAARGVRPTLDDPTATRIWTVVFNNDLGLWDLTTRPGVVADSDSREALVAALADAIAKEVVTELGIGESFVGE